MKQMSYEPGSGRSTAPGAPEIKIHTERLASDLSSVRQFIFNNLGIGNMPFAALLWRGSTCVQQI